MRRAAKVFAWSAGAVLVIAFALLAYLHNADLTIYKGRIERIASESLGHDVSIDGAFVLQVGRSTTLEVENVTISNESWPDDRPLLRLGRAAVAVKTLSLLFGPADIESLRVDSVDIAVLRNVDGDSNWHTHGDQSRDSVEAPREVDLANMFVFRDVRLTEFSLVLEDPSREAPLALHVDAFTVVPDPDGTLTLDLDGSVNGATLALDGRIGTLHGLLRRTAVSANLNLRLQDLELELEGTVANLGLLRGTESHLTVRGPAAESVIDTLGLPPFASGPYEVTARIRQQDASNVLELAGNVGAIELSANGRVDDFRSPQSVDLDFKFKGPESAYIAALFGVEDARRAAFDVSGGVRQRGQRFEFIDTRIVLGEGQLLVDGWLQLTGGVPDMDLNVSARGRNFASFDPFIPVDGLPAEPFDIAGELQKSGNEWNVSKMAARIGTIDIRAAGRITEASAETNRIELRASGPDAAVLRELTKLGGLPHKPFEVSVDLRGTNGGIQVDRASAGVGSNRFEASGWINPNDAFAGTALDLRAAGADLSHVVVLQDVPNLPAGPFEIVGQVQVDARQVLFAGVRATAGDILATAAGQLRRNTATLALSADVALEGQDVMAGIPHPPFDRFPGKPYRIAARLEIDGNTVRIRNPSLALAELQTATDGIVEFSAGALSRTDVSLRVSAPSAEILKLLTGLDSLPAGALAVTGALATDAETIRVSDLDARLGAHVLRVSGSVNRRPPHSGNDIRVQFGGPDLNAVMSVFGVTAFAPLPYDLSVQLDGTPTGFHGKDIRLSMGESDIGGDVEADVSREFPVIRAAFRSTNLDLRRVEGRLREQVDVQAETGANKKTLPDDARLIPGEPFDFGWLDFGYVDLSYAAERVQRPFGDFNDLSLAIQLEPGRFAVERLMLDQKDGHLHGSFSVVRNDRVFDMAATLEIENGHPPVIAAPGQDPATIPAFNVQMDLRGSGTSLAEVADSANGYLFAFIDKGKLDVPRFDLLFSDLVTSIVRTINPIASKSPYTLIDCATLDSTVASGVATIDHLAVQTNELQVVGTGSINLGTEKLDLGFQTKPREGLGVSVGGIINSLFRVRGTLAKPAIEIDPAGTAKKTGFAFATGGLSIVAKSLFDRLSAEADMCRKLPRTRQR